LTGEAEAIRALVERAYAPWVDVIGRRPAPMDDDYQRHVAAGEVVVLCREDAIAAIAVIVRLPDHLLLHNIAVDPAHKWQGLGREMLHFVETEARRLSLQWVRLFTHVRMISNLRLYQRAGFHETGRTTVDGFDRVFLEKPVNRP